MGDESDDRDDRDDQSRDHPENSRDQRNQEPRPRREAEPTSAGRHDHRDHRDDRPLITERLESRTFGRLPRVDAHCTYVLAYGGGEMRAFSHTPRFGDRAGTNRCYVVDTSPRSLHGTMRLPARGGRYFFDATYDVRWRVTDPVQVVRDNLHDGHDSVDGFLWGKLGPIGRQYDPEDAEGFEIHIYNRLGAAAEAPGLPVGNGLGLIALTVVVTSDPRVIDRGVELDDDVHEGTITERRMRRLEHLLDGDGSAIRYHLARNPSDSAAVLQMIMEAKDKSERLRLEWLDRMRADDAIQDADYEQARAAVLGGGSASPPELDTGSSRAWRNTTPPIIEAGPPTAPQPGPADNPFEAPGPTPAPEPTTPAASPPPPYDPNPFAAPSGSPWSPDPEPEVPPLGRHPTPPPREHDPEPTTTADERLGAPSAPRDVRASRLAGGSVLVQWRDAGDVEYRVRRRLDDGQWHVVGHTEDTFIEDDEAPPGAVRVYAVSAITGGLRSRESHSGS